ncbi:MAG: hypothetical protein AAFR34_09515, partial [Pseudomonadota bacterium]
QAGRATAGGMAQHQVADALYGSKAHLPQRPRVPIATAPALWGGQSLARRLRLVPGGPAYCVTV